MDWCYQATRQGGAVGEFDVGRTTPGTSGSALTPGPGRHWFLLAAVNPARRTYRRFLRAVGAILGRTPFVIWLRTHLLGDASITFNCAEGVEVEYPPGTLPTGIDETAIRSALTAHLEAVEDLYRS